MSEALLTPLTARRGGPLTGRIRVPGDKSISHRALILGAMTVGETRISGLLEGEDVLNTASAMRALGARVESLGGGNWSIHGVGVGGFAEPAAPLDFGNSGTGKTSIINLIAGLVAPDRGTIVLDGERQMARTASPRLGADTAAVLDLLRGAAGAGDPPR